MKYAAQRILVINTRQLGDALLCTPLIHALRVAYPEAELDVLVYQGSEGMMLGNPDISRVITVPKRPKWRDYGRLILQLYRRYDLALSTLTGDRPILYAFLAGKKRFGIVEPHRGRSKRMLLNAWTELDDAKTPTIVQNLRLADLLGLPRHYQVRLPHSPTAHENLTRLLPFPWQITPYAVLHVSPMWHYKRWHNAGWRTLAAHLISQGYKVVLTGSQSASEQQYISSIFPEALPELIHTAGKLTFAEVAALIQAAQVYIGPDTAVTHIAAATGTPTIALFGPTNPLKWAPWPADYTLGSPPFAKVGRYQINGNVILLQGPGSCVPCHEEGCDQHKESHSDCLDGLPAEEVIAALVEARKLVGS